MIANNNKRNKLPNNTREHKINEEIRSSYVYLIDSENDNKGKSVSFFEALNLARHHRLDLVQVGMNSDMPVCKMMNYGKYCFEKNKNKSNSKKNTQKDIQISPNIQENDLNVKLARSEEFLKRKYKVQIILKMIGRQADYPDLARDMMLKFVSHCSEIAKVELGPKIEGKRGFLILVPK